MFGGYFGDFIDVFSKVYLHKPVTVKPVWFAPLNEPYETSGVLHAVWPDPYVPGMGLMGY